jgi:hypothetical protein
LKDACDSEYLLVDWEKSMVPALSHQAWRELIVGSNPIVSSKFGFNLLLTNNRLYYRRGQSDEENVAQSVRQLYDYLFKYEGLYQDELKTIFGEDYVGLFPR